jgi:hypothetical protein
VFKQNDNIMCSLEAILKLCDNPKDKIDATKVRKLAAKCKLTSGLRCKCWHLLSIQPQDLEGYVSVEQQFQVFIDDVISVPNVPSTKYKGYAETAVFGLLYLLRRNENECVVLSNFANMSKQLLQNKRLKMDDVPLLDWSEVGFVYGWNKRLGDYDFIYPGNNKQMFLDGMAQCLESETTRFAFNIVTLSNRNGSNHANILLYDRVMHTAERFDPYQVQLPGMNLEKFDSQLCNMYQDIDPDFHTFYSPPNLDFFSAHGLQGSQENEKEMKFLDPVGFCQPFTFLIADTRMSFPEQDTRSIVDRYRKAARDNNITITTFIRNYTDHLFQTAQVIYKRYLNQKNGFRDFDDARVPLLAIMLDQLSIYKTVMT